MSLDEEIMKNSIKFLHNLSETMPNCYPTVKSYYASKSRVLELRGNLYLPQEITKATVRCPRCCLSFADYPPSVTLKPKKKVDRFTKKIMRKQEERELLTLYQRKHYEELKDMNCRVIIKKCEICKNENNLAIKIAEPKKIGFSPRPSIKKKKKKKDKFCGLAESAVINPSGKKRQKEQSTSNEPIKYNVIGKIESIMNQHNRIKKKRKKNVVPPKSTKDKIIEKKKNKAKQQTEKKLKNLLEGLGKSKISNKLKNFLEDL